jgi:hypothetical protein
VNSNGGISLGTSNTTVAAGNTFVSGSLGVGTASPTERLQVEVPNSLNDGLMVSNGSAQMLFAPLRMFSSSNYLIESFFALDLDSGTDMTLTADTTIDLDAGSTLSLASPIEIDISSGNFLDLNAGGNIAIDAGGTVFVEGTTFLGNDVTIADDLNVNNDIIVSSTATIGGPKAFTFGLNVYGSAGKPGGGSWSVFSDERLKKNITPMTGSLNTIAALRPVNFEYKSDDHFSYLPGIQRGFIAQEVQNVIPQWVHTADDGYYYLDQTGYEALIVDAIQELRAEKNTQIKQLKTENQILQARLDRLERAVFILSQ